MKINNPGLQQITISGGANANINISAAGSYKIDPVNDDIGGICKGEILRGHVGMGTLTLTIGDQYTPAGGENAVNWLDRVCNGLMTLIQEA